MSVSVVKSEEIDLSRLVRELQAIADYVSGLKREIGSLRANELMRQRIPVAHDELGQVVDTTANATNSIMQAAEEILAYDDDTLEAYRDRVQGKVMEIFEACSFQDLTGQRINKVLDNIAQIEKRLAQFASAVKVRDASPEQDPDEILSEARRRAFLLNGPAAAGEGVSQSDIDSLFA